jgi:hypothetical protein
MRSGLRREFGGCFRTILNEISEAQFRGGIHGSRRPET